ncbi:hypothetical protein GOFOIKOB_5176 [Methylobacterium tardum]|uniref:TniQ domain-containing protein n=1 Tax=Methylobacterium tardum TaxID=374432 RepID=A0AA37TI14_9HYPH|nr:TniQ family protein [Methylobacterium tardum]GJE52108.1 hypothetical protein GOFOIKOB_5176 [Methylobacterium tardum]GLS71663.1 hypothetical protein GCM10007890_36760 [Methylobacterium tardum]
MTPPLVLRFDLKADESVPSWISRLAVHNGAGTAREFCLDMGFTFQDCVDGEPAALTKLSALTGTPVEMLERASLRADGSNFLLGPERLSHKLLRRTKVHVCPLCARDDIEAAARTGEPAPYGRTLWQLSVIRTCLDHHRALIQIAEGARTSTHDFTRLLQGRAAEILQAAKLPLARAPSSLERYVVDRLTGKPTGAPWLDQLDLYAATATCELLGALITVGAKAKMKSLSESALHHAGDVGCTIARGGETAIQEVLSDVYRRHVFKPHGSEGPPGVFGVLYQSLSLRQNESIFAPVRDMVRRQIAEIMPVGPGDIILQQPVETRVYHSITSAARETGRHPARLRRILAAAGLIRPDHAQIPDNLVTFEVESGRALLEAHTDSVPLNEVRRYLGTSLAQANLIVEHGFIQPRIKNRGKRNQKLNAFSRDDIDQFLARLSDGIEPVSIISKVMFPIAAASRRARCNLIDVIKLISDKKLKRVAIHSELDGLSSIFVDPNEVAYRLLEDGDAVTMEMARSVLWVNPTIVAALIEKNYLTSTMSVHPLARNVVRCIERDSFEAFNHTYVSAAELAGYSRLRYRRVWYAVKKCRPAIAKDVARANFYWRDAIPIIGPRAEKRNKIER